MEIKKSGRPMHSTFSMKRVIVRTPGGRLVEHFGYKTHSKHTCALCKKELAGKPRGRPIEIRKLSKCERNPVRPFGGMLCSKDTRMIISYRAKVRHGEMKKEDVPLSLRGYL